MRMFQFAPSALWNNIHPWIVSRVTQDSVVDDIPTPCHHQSVVFPQGQDCVPFFIRSPVQPVWVSKWVLNLIPSQTYHYALVMAEEMLWYTLSLMHVKRSTLFHLCTLDWEKCNPKIWGICGRDWSAPNRNLVIRKALCTCSCIYNPHNQRFGSNWFYFLFCVEGKANLEPTFSLFLKNKSYKALVCKSLFPHLMHLH